MPKLSFSREEQPYADFIRASPGIGDQDPYEELIKAQKQPRQVKTAPVNDDTEYESLIKSQSRPAVNPPATKPRSITRVASLDEIHRPIVQNAQPKIRVPGAVPLSPRILRDLSPPAGKSVNPSALAKPTTNDIRANLGLPAPASDTVGSDIVARSNERVPEVRPIVPRETQQAQNRAAIDRRFQELKDRQAAVSQQYSRYGAQEAKNLPVRSDDELRHQAEQDVVSQLSAQGKREANRSSTLGRFTETALNAADAQSALREGIGTAVPFEANVVRGQASAVGSTLRQAGNLARPSDWLWSEVTGYDPGVSTALRGAGEKMQAGAEKQGEQPSRLEKRLGIDPSSTVGQVERGVSEGVGHATVELPKLLLGGPILKAANLPIQGALSRADEGVPGLVKGAAGGLLYHYGGGAVGKVLGGLGPAMASVGNTLVWVGGPAAEAHLVNGVPWSKAIADAIPMGVFAGVSGGIEGAKAYQAKAQVRDGGKVREATVDDLPQIVNKELEIVPPAPDTVEKPAVEIHHSNLQPRAEDGTFDGPPVAELKATDGTVVVHSGEVRQPMENEYYLAKGKVRKSSRDSVPGESEYPILSPKTEADNAQAETANQNLAVRPTPPKGQQTAINQAPVDVSPTRGPVETIQPEPIQVEKPSGPASEEVLSQSINSVGSSPHPLAKAILSNPKWRTRVLAELGEGAKPIETTDAGASFRTANGDTVRIYNAYGRADGPLTEDRNETVIQSAEEPYEQLIREQKAGENVVDDAPETPIQAGADQIAEKTTGIAQRVEDKRRAEAGKDQSSPGEGISAQDSVERGRQLLSDGRDPQAVVDAFEKDKAISADGMALVRAKHEELAKAANRAFDEGGQNLNNPKFKAAEKARQDWWEQSVKPMQTEWHKTGMAQQGETGIDTGTFYGIYRAFKDATGREMTPTEERAARSLSSRVATTDAEVKAATKTLQDALDKATARNADLEERLRNAGTSKAVDKIKRDVAREGRGQGRQAKKATLDDEAEQLKQLIAQAAKKLGRSIIGKSGGDSTTLHSGLGPLDEITTLVIKLARNRVQANLGIKAEALVDQVHGLLQDVSDLSRRDVREMITGWGRTAKPRSELQVKLDALKSELHKGLVDEEIAAGRRDSPEMKRAKTTARNRVEELNKWVADGRRPTRGKSELIPDAELKAIHAERDTLQKVVDAFDKPTTDPQDKAIERALKVVEKSIADNEVRLAPGGDLSPKRSTASPWSEELGQRQKVAADLRDQVDAARKAAEPQTDPEDARIDAALKAKQKAIDAEKEIIRTGLKPNKATPSVPWSPELGKLGRELANLKAERAARERAATQPARDAKRAQSALEAKLRAANKAVDETQGKIDRHETAARQRTPQPTTPQIEAVRAQNKLLNDILRDMRTSERRATRESEIASGDRSAKQQGPRNTWPARRKVIESKIAEYERQVAEQDFPTTKPKGKTVDPQSVLDLKAKYGSAKHLAATAALRARLSQRGEVAPEDTQAVWEHARDYIDRGEDFGSARQKTATDLGLTTEQVARALTQKPDVRRMTDEMYRKMGARRSARSQAEAWVRNADTSAPVKALQTLRDTMFNIKIGGGLHGTVGPVTHAGENLFHPSRYADYFTNVGRTWKALVNAGYHEELMQRLENDPNFTMWQRSGLAVDPKKSYDPTYENALMMKILGKPDSKMRTALAAGNRGFSVLKMMRLDFANSRWNRLADSQKTPEMAERIAQLANHATGAISGPVPGGEAGKWIARNMMFAGPLEASRWARGKDIAEAGTILAKMAARQKVTPEDAYFMKSVAKNAGEFAAAYGIALALNQGILMATGSKDRVNITDPSKGDFLRFKIKGRAIEPTGGMIATIDFLGKLGNIGLGKQDPREGRAGRTGKALFNYGRGKLSPIASTGADIAFQADYGGRPMPFSSDKERAGKPRYSWGEYLATQQTPIPISEAVRDANETMRQEHVPGTFMQALMSGAATKSIAKGIAIGALSGASGIRIGQEYPESEKAKAAELKESDMKRLRAGENITGELRQQGFSKGSITSMKRDAKLTPYQVEFSNKRPVDALASYESLGDDDRTKLKQQMQYKAYALVKRADYLVSYAGAKDKPQREKDRADLQQRLDTLKIEPKRPETNRANGLPSAGGVPRLPRLHL